MQGHVRTRNGSGLCNLKSNFGFRGLGLGLGRGRDGFLVLSLGGVAAALSRFSDLGRMAAGPPGRGGVPSWPRTGLSSILEVFYFSGIRVGIVVRPSFQRVEFCLKSFPSLFFRFCLASFIRQVSNYSVFPIWGLVAMLYFFPVLFFFFFKFHWLQTHAGRGLLS